MNYTVQSVKSLFEKNNIPVKQGTIEAYRDKLISVGLLSNNQSMSEEQVKTFEKIVRKKTDDLTWENLMYEFIYSDFSEKMKTEFNWQIKIIIKHLIWAINSNKYKVFSLDFNEDGENYSEDFHVFCCCIDNFAEMGRNYAPYQNSHGTDGNPILSYKIITPVNKVYYLIGKLNPYTKKEDIHIFYNDETYFDIMKCQYIGGGTCDNDSNCNDLWKICRLKSNKYINITITNAMPTMA